MENDSTGIMTMSVSVQHGRREEMTWFLCHLSAFVGKPENKIYCIYIWFYITIVNLQLLSIFHILCLLRFKLSSGYFSVYSEGTKSSNFYILTCWWNRSHWQLGFFYTQILPRCPQMPLTPLRLAVQLIHQLWHQACNLLFTSPTCNHLR